MLANRKVCRRRSDTGLVGEALRAHVVRAGDAALYANVAEKLKSNISLLCSVYKFIGNFSGAGSFANNSENASVFMNTCSLCPT